MKKNFGSVEYKGKVLWLQQEAYITALIGQSKYECIALAEDDDYEYEVSWDIVDFQCEDESDACDWEVYDVKILGRR